MNNNEIQNLIKELLEKMTIPVNEISVNEDGLGSSNCKSKIICYSVEVGNPHLLLGRNAEALAALNHLAKRIVEAKMPRNEEGITENAQGILIDINGFQKKRIEGIHAVAHMMAERARYFKSNIEVDPMSSFDRRIVHEFLAEATDLKTESIGEGFSRRVVIKYIGGI